MTGAGVLHGAGARVEQRVEDAHERARAAGAAQRAVEQPQHRGRRRIEIDGETQRGVRDRHQQTGGHAVAAGVAHHDREPAVRRAARSRSSRRRPRSRCDTSARCGSPADRERCAAAGRPGARAPPASSSRTRMRSTSSSASRKTSAEIERMSQPEVRTDREVGRPRPFVEHRIWTSKRPTTNASIAPAKSRRRAGVSL